MTRRDSPPSRLDENDDPDRGTLSACSVAWLIFHQRNPTGSISPNGRGAGRAAQHRFPPGDLDKPKRLYFGTDIIGSHQEPYHRGFPYFIACQMQGAEWTREGTRVVSGSRDSSGQRLSGGSTRMRSPPGRWRNSASPASG